MSNIPISIHDEQFFLEKIKGKQEFYPKEVAMIFIKEGELSFLVNGTSQNYSNSNILFISPRNIYKLQSISTHVKLYVIGIYPSTRNYFRYNFNRFNVYQALNSEENNAIKISEIDFEGFWGVLKYMHYIYQQKGKEYRDDIITHSFNTVAYSIVSAIESRMIQSENSQEPNSRKEDITLKFLDLVSNHFLEEKELKFYADNLFISIKYLSICVKEISGHPPTYFIHQLLIDEACKRLTDNKFSIADIGYDLGFADQFVFSKFFKKHTKQTPSQFRKKINQAHTI
ncbi:MAG: AraC family transcriptional regulator [Chitinophagales bacterium]|nr:AraC family transcriptional regulator [Chitinophagales bacterium]